MFEVSSSEDLRLQSSDLRYSAI